MGAEEKTGKGLQFEGFVDMNSPIPREREGRMEELLRLLHAHVHLPPPARIDQEVSPEQLTEERQSLQVFSDKQLSQQIRRERKRLKQELVDQYQSRSISAMP